MTIRPGGCLSSDADGARGHEVSAGTQARGAGVLNRGAARLTWLVRRRDGGRSLDSGFELAREVHRALAGEAHGVPVGDPGDDGRAVSSSSRDEDWLRWCGSSRKSPRPNSSHDPGGSSLSQTPEEESRE